MFLQSGDEKAHWTMFSNFRYHPRSVVSLAAIWKCVFSLRASCLIL